MFPSCFAFPLFVFQAFVPKLMTFDVYDPECSKEQTVDGMKYRPVVPNVVFGSVACDVQLYT